MNKKLFKTITFGIPVVLGCITACSAISTHSQTNTFDTTCLPSKYLQIKEVGGYKVFVGLDYDTYSKEECEDKGYTTLLIPADVEIVEETNFLLPNPSDPYHPIYNLPNSIKTLKFEKGSKFLAADDNAFAFLPFEVLDLSECKNLSIVDLFEFFALMPSLKHIEVYKGKDALFGRAENLGDNCEIFVTDKDKNGKWFYTNENVKEKRMNVLSGIGVPDLSKFDHITEDAFYSSNISDFICPENLKSIGRIAFGNNMTLTKISINAANLTLIDREAFWDCHFLSEITFNGLTSSNYKQLEIGENAFSDLNDFSTSIVDILFKNSGTWTAAQKHELEEKFNNAAYQTSLRFIYN